MDGGLSSTKLRFVALILPGRNRWTQRRRNGYRSITSQCNPPTFPSTSNTHKEEIMHMLRSLGNDKTFTQPVVWVTTFFIAAFHVGAIAALFFFSWRAFAVAMLLWWIAGGVG